jgi:hypothetical protein
MKNEYVIRAGGEPAAIRLKYDGAKALAVNAKGQLEVQTSTGMLIEDVPLSYQIIDGKKREVRARYQLSTDDTFQFEVDAYRKDTELVIDPLTFATYLGGSATDAGRKIAIDGSGTPMLQEKLGRAAFPRPQARMIPVIMEGLTFSSPSLIPPGALSSFRRS